MSKDSTELEANVSELIRSKDQSSNLISSIYHSISNSYDMPDPQFIGEQIIDKVNKLKTKNIIVERELDTIRSRAMSLGYTGTTVAPAVDFLVSTYSEIERQRAMEKMQSELAQVNQIHQKQKMAEEIYRSESKRQMEELRSRMRESESKSYQTIQQLRMDLDSEKSKSLHLASELENERRKKSYTIEDTEIHI